MTRSNNCKSPYLPLILLVAAAGCAGVAEVPAEALTPASEQAQLAELEQLEVPPGADAATFEALKSALASLLLRGAQRQASGITDSEVKDLVVLATPNGGAQLHWTFSNTGDYDQNGEVAVGDITPLGMNFGASSASPVWTLKQVADGDGNGEVNLADLSPIGSNLGSKLQGYRVLAKSPTENEPQVLAEIAVQAGTILPGQSIRRFSYEAATMPEGTLFYVAAYEGGMQGALSKPQPLSYTAPLVESVTPLSGKAGATITLRAEFSGSLPSSFSWSFGGGIEPAESSDPQPSISLLEEGPQQCNLTVDSQYGRSEYDFVIEVQANQAPQAHLAALPGSDAEAGLTRLDATGSQDPDGSIVEYEWDFDGDSSWDAQTGSTPNVEHAFAPGSHTAQVRVTDNDGATDIAAVTFTAEDPNLPPEAYLNAAPGTIVAPMQVHLDATGSFDADGAVVKYEWDPYGIGIWLVDTGGTSTLDFQFDAPPGNYEAAVRVTDDEGKTSTETFSIKVTGAQFLGVATESFSVKSKPGDNNATKWLKDMYRPLGEVRDPNRAYQTAFFCMWADKVVEMVNAQRMAHGLTTVKREPHLELVIQAHVRDLALQNYFNHDNLMGMDPGDRLYTINPPVYDYWGENLNAGAGYTNGNTTPDSNGPDQVLEDWMNSQKHRDNILRASYEYVGVGLYYLPSGPYRCYWGLLFGGGPNADPASAEYIYPLDVQL